MFTGIFSKSKMSIKIIQEGDSNAKNIMSSGKVNAWQNENCVDLSLVHFSTEVTVIINGNWCEARVVAVAEPQLWEG